MKNVTLLWIIAALLFAVSSVASAQTIELSFNASKHISLNQNIAQIFVGTKSIVKVSQPTDALNEFVITANEKTGSTTVFVWTVDGAKYEYTVHVVDDKIAEVGVIEREIGLPNVRVRKIGGKILLQGTVADDAEYEHVMKIVSLFVDSPKIVRRAAFDPGTMEYHSETSTEGGGNVIDELKVLNPSYESLSPEKKIEKIIGLPDVHIEKMGDKMLIQGTVENEEEHQRILGIVSQSATMGFVDGLKIFPREKKVEAAIGLPDVHVKIVEGRLLLTGTVKNQYERNQALQIARLYVGSGSKSSLTFGSNVNMEMTTQSSDSDSSGTLASNNKVEDSGAVIDLLQMLNPTQIRLEAQVIEINSDKAKDLGITYGQNGEGGIFSIGENNDRTVNTETYRYWDSENNRWASYSIETGSSVEAFGKRPLKWIEQRFGAINATVHALVSKGKARILSRPSVITMSGEQAMIQIGGKIPYPVSNLNGTTVHFENYGVILQFKPIVDAQNRVVTTVHTEVSSLSGQAVNGQPIIITRRADSIVTLNSGSTMVIGGLMDSSESKAISKIPLLGDIPIIGEFFKYTSKRRDKRELIILVTPYIVEDTSRAGMSDSMRDYYHEGQREKNSLNDVDLNSPPPEIKTKERESQKQNKSGAIFGDAF